MTPAEQLRLDKLLELARQRFCTELRPVEEQILCHSCGFADPDDGGPELAWHAAGAEAGLDGSIPRIFGPYVGPGQRPLPGWPGPEVRADFLRWLLLDKDALQLLDPKGLRVWAARFTEPLDLSRCGVDVVLEFRYCVMEKCLHMNGSRLKEMDLVSSTVMGPLQAAGATLEGSMLLQNSGFAEIDFRTASIGGNLEMEGSRIAGDMTCDGMAVAGSVLLNEGFACDGFVNFTAGQIGAQLNMMGAELNARGQALNLDGVSVGQSVYLSSVECAGDVNMVGTRVGKMVYCQGSRIRLLNAEALEANQLMWTDFPLDHTAELSLRLGKIQTLLVDESSLAGTTCIRLNHLQLQAITDHAGHLLDADACLRWLDLQPADERTEQQPWMQLSRIRDGAGDALGARHLVYELRRRQFDRRWPRQNLRNGAFRVVAKRFAWLEENPFRILWPLVFLLAAGTLVFHGFRAHFAETNEAAYRATHTACAGPVRRPADCPVTASYPRFSSFVYTLENTLPVVKLGQDDAWAPHVDAASRYQAVYWELAALRWLLILSGWVMGGILGAAIAARFRT